MKPLHSPLSRALSRARAPLGALSSEQTGPSDLPHLDAGCSLPVEEPQSSTGQSQFRGELLPVTEPSPSLVTGSSEPKEEDVLRVFLLR